MTKLNKMAGDIIIQKNIRTQLIFMYTKIAMQQINRNIFMIMPNKIYGYEYDIMHNPTISSHFSIFITIFSQSISLADTPMSVCTLLLSFLYQFRENHVCLPLRR